MHVDCSWSIEQWAGGRDRADRLAKPPVARIKAANTANTTRHRSPKTRRGVECVPRPQRSYRRRWLSSFRVEQRAKRRRPIDWAASARQRHPSDTVRKYSVFTIYSPRKPRAGVGRQLRGRRSPICVL
ncbi:hypothetical protein ACJJTC_017847 [Scirpophaga incertulas]